MKKPSFILGKKHMTSYLLAAPYLIVFAVFYIVPVAMSLYFGFTYFNILEPAKFIGLSNYYRLFFEDAIFITALKNTVLMAVLIGPIGYLISLILAWLINDLSDRLRAVLTFLFYVPSISGNIYLIWAVLFSSDMYGYVNGALLRAGIINTPILFLQDPKYMLPIVVLVALWASLGTSFLAFIAGFKGVDKQYYEAGMIDGITNRWQELWFITLPIMRPQLMFGAVMSISSSFGVGAIGTALCGFPSSNYAVHTIMNHLEDFGALRFEMGYACAISTVLFIIMVGSNLIIQKVIAKVGE